MDRTLAVTTLTLENFERMFTRDTRLLASLGITAIFVLATLGIFNVTFALLLALTTTAVPRALGAFFRAVWLLPRMGCGGSRRRGGRDDSGRTPNRLLLRVGLAGRPREVRVDRHERKRIRSLSTLDRDGPVACLLTGKI